MAGGLVTSGRIVRLDPPVGVPLGPVSSMVAREPHVPHRGAISLELRVLPGEGRSEVEHQADMLLGSRIDVLQLIRRNPGLQLDPEAISHPVDVCVIGCDLRDLKNVLI